jgi:hypothetical protein
MQMNYMSKQRETRHDSEYTGEEISMGEQSTTQEITSHNTFIKKNVECCCNSKAGDYETDKFGKIKCICGCDLDESNFNLPSKMTIGKLLSFRKSKLTTNYYFERIHTSKFSICIYMNLTKIYRNSEGKLEPERPKRQTRVNDNLTTPIHANHHQPESKNPRLLP